MIINYITVILGKNCWTPKGEWKRKEVTAAIAMNNI